MIEVQKPVAPEVVTPLKPSEAMRLGRMAYPERCTGLLAEGSGNGWAVCALGATAVGYGWEPGDDDATEDAGWRVAYDRFPAQYTDCPADCDWKSERRVTQVVYHLNDEHDWPTERIADWLEELGL